MLNKLYIPMFISVTFSVNKFITDERLPFEESIITIFQCLLVLFLVLTSL